jgi:hypothetical protein
MGFFVGLVSIGVEPIGVVGGVNSGIGNAVAVVVWFHNGFLLRDVARVQDKICGSKGCEVAHTLEDEMVY